MLAAPNTTIAWCSRFDIGLVVLQYDKRPRETLIWAPPGSVASAYQPPGRSRTVRAPAEGTAGSVRRSVVATACTKKLQSLLGEDEQ